MAAQPCLACRQEHDQRNRGLGRGQKPQLNRGDHAERTLGADEQALEVVAGDILCGPAADVHELAWSEHDLDTGDPGAGDAVLERVRPAGVGGDVAADLRLLGRAGVGAEEQPVLAREALHVACAHAGLGEHPPQRRLQLADAAQPLERADDATLRRDRASHKPGAAAARHDRYVVLVAPGDHSSDLLRAPRQCDRVGVPLDAPTVGAVVVVGRPDGRLEHVLRADDAAELADDRGGIAGGHRSWALLGHSWQRHGDDVESVDAAEVGGIARVERQLVGDSGGGNHRVVGACARLATGAP